METIQQQIGALQVIVAKQQVSVKRQRFAIVALAGVILAGGFIAAVRPAGDATFDTITCKAWKVIDKDGKTRIATGTTPEGGLHMFWLDKDGKFRINVGTGDKSNQASVTLCDKDEKPRISAGTCDDGLASVDFIDKEGKERIGVATLPDGNAIVQWFDKDQKSRISAATLVDGTVQLPTKDLNPPKP